MDNNNSEIEQIIILLDKLLEIAWKYLIEVLKFIALIFIRIFIFFESIFRKVSHSFRKYNLKTNMDSSDRSSSNESSSNDSSSNDSFSNDSSLDESSSNEGSSNRNSSKNKYFNEEYLKQKFVIIKNFSSKSFYAKNKRKIKIAVVTIILSVLSILVYNYVSRDKPMKMNNPHNIHGIVNMQRTFNDLNPIQLKAAKKWGISPLKDRSELDKVKKDLKHIESCELYKVDKLTHSIPYLVPNSEKLLNDIGQNFRDSLENKGLNPNCIIVTSLLRTRKDQQKLSRGNVNAANESTHMFATTFDIAYNRFHKIEDSWGYPTEDVDDYTLKLVLSEVIYDLMKAKRCYVKYEVRQGCFHITAN